MGGRSWEERSEMGRENVGGEGVGCREESGRESKEDFLPE